VCGGVIQEGVKGECESQKVKQYGQSMLILNTVLGAGILAYIVYDFKKDKFNKDIDYLLKDNKQSEVRIDNSLQ
jgi:hypothetical protein